MRTRAHEGEMGENREQTRDMVGYGRTPPDPQWPNEARVAVQFVVNYEEGAERCVLNGDCESEAFLSEISGATPLQGVRHMNMESLYEYGSRAGFWRLMRIFGDRDAPFTSFAVAQALAKNPAAGRAMIEAGHEVASHGYRWIDYQYLDPEVERQHIADAVRIHTEVCGSRPLGFYQGRSSPNTGRLCAEEGGFLYHSDSYADDLPYYEQVGQHTQLVVPYTLDANDMRFSTAAGFSYGEDFFRYLKDSFDQLWEEGADRPVMLSVGLHCRLVGRPGRARNLQRFLDHVLSRDKVWVARRVDIARHWLERHPHTEGAPSDGPKENS